MEKTAKPSGAFCVIAGSMAISFSCGTGIAGYFIDKFTPYVLFGAEAVKSKNITIVKNYRGLIEFSNGVALRGVKLLPIDLIWGVIGSFFTLCIWFFLLRLSLLFCRKISPTAASDITEWLLTIKASLLAKKR